MFKKGNNGLYSSNIDFYLFDNDRSQKEVEQRKNTSHLCRVLFRRNLNQ